MRPARAARAVLAMLLLAGTGLVRAAAPAAPATPVAVWTWERESYAMLESREAATAAFDFLRTHGVDTIYLYADAFEGRNLIVDAPARYHAFIARAHRAGFRVHALLGSAYLHTERYILPAQREAALAMLRRVLAYNAAAPRAARFDGASLDIEPHLLDDWSDAHREALLQQFLDASAAWMALRGESTQALPIGAAVPFWFDGIPVRWRGRTRPASEHLADVYDQLVLMDYRHQAEGDDGIVAHAAREMAYAERAHRRVVVGLELTPNALAKVTFAGLREDDLRRAMAATVAAYGRSPAFGGFALHHYGSYRAWVQAPP